MFVCADFTRILTAWRFTACGMCAVVSPSGNHCCLKVTDRISEFTLNYSTFHVCVCMWVQHMIEENQFYFVKNLELFNGILSLCFATNPLEICCMCRRQWDEHITMINIKWTSVRIVSILTNWHPHTLTLTLTRHTIRSRMHRAVISWPRNHRF